jgi:hypothetical protein
MINNDITMGRKDNMSVRPYASLPGRGRAQNYAASRHMRARFLQQSAQYLGADLRDRKVLSLCFGNNPLATASAGK